MCIWTHKTDKSNRCLKKTVDLFFILHKGAKTQLLQYCAFDRSIIRFSNQITY